MASKKLETTVSIDRVDIGLFSRVKIKGFYVEDYQRDTLLYVGRIDAFVTGLGIFGGGLSLSRGEIADAKLYLRETPSGEMNIKQVVDKLSKKDKARAEGKFRLEIERLETDGLDFSMERLEHRNPSYGVDFADMHLIDIRAELKNFTIDGPVIHTDIGRWRCASAADLSSKTWRAVFASPTAVSISGRDTFGRRSRISSCLRFH